MKFRSLTGMLLLAGIVYSGCSCRKSSRQTGSEYSGSQSCIECHEEFYQLWSTSFHGKSMQPVDQLFFIENDIQPGPAFQIESKTYRIALEDTSLILIETDGKVENTYNLTWALGGKNVFYFLTPFEKGKFQVIPLAYDVSEKKWYNNPESAIRHFAEGIPDKALSWKDRMYTFNSSCYNCHVSQLSTNYNPADDSYKTSWNEPGINCETCHGPSGAHTKIFRNKKSGEKTKDLKIISTKLFSADQHNASCSSCHAKMKPLTTSFVPGSRYYDHFDLTTLESQDFYPDGRDLGENYTMTGWSMNRCAANGDLHCVFCHTSSGRTRFKGEESDRLCLPCHLEKVENISNHTNHQSASEGSRCVNCHLPKTTFGRMVRSDHSFRPPMPQASIRFGSPNACTLCHTDQKNEWADSVIKKWKDSGYQEKTLEWAQLIKEARAGDWKNLEKISNTVSSGVYGEVVTNSLIRLIYTCPGGEKTEIFQNTSENSSPLVRSSAISGLAGNFDSITKKILIKACSDDYRIVRIAAALSLSGFPTRGFSDSEKSLISKTTQEYIQSLIVRADDWSSYYNMGIYYQNRGDYSAALASYQIAGKLYPRAVLPKINSSILYSLLGNDISAEQSLREVLETEPENEAANLNLGLLLAGSGRKNEAERVLLKVLEINPRQAVAAYNLSVIKADTNLKEAVKYASIATAILSSEPRYSYTYAYFLYQAGDVEKAIKSLKNTLDKNPQHIDSIFLLTELYLESDKKSEAVKLLEHTLTLENISENEKIKIRGRIHQIQEGR